MQGVPTEGELPVNRVLSLLLIPLFMLGQAMPHSHAGTGVFESEDQASRPHVHLSVDHSHHHGDDQGHADNEQNDKPVTSEADSRGSSAYLLPCGYDAGAIYVGQNFASIDRSSAPISIDVGDFGSVIEFWGDLGVPTPASLRPAWSERHAGLPIYLLVASLRL